MPDKTPKALIDTMSSKLDAAITSVLTPFSPYPICFNRNRFGTKTAGLTADKTNLIQIKQKYGFYKIPNCKVRIWNVSGWHVCIGKYILRL